MVVAIICGALAGIVGFAPLLVGLNMTKKVTSTSNFSGMNILVISLILSFALMFAFAIICANVAHDVAVYFVFAEAVALSVAAIAFGVMRLRNNGKER